MVDYRNFSITSIVYNLSKSLLWKQNQTDVLVIRKDWHLPPTYIDNLPTLAATSVLNPIIHTKLK
jgi:hypothetical protein